MSRLLKLYQKALGSPANFRFSDLVSLLRGAGYEFEKQKGSHQFFRHPLTKDKVNVQDDHGEAKPYQVRQVVAKIREFDLLEEE